MREKGKGTRGRGNRCLSQRDKGWPLDREETDVAHGQMAIYQSKRGNPVLG